MNYTRFKRRLVFFKKVQLSRIVKTMVYVTALARKFGLFSSAPSNFSVVIVLNPLNRGWVIEKLAKRLIAQAEPKIRIKLSVFPRSKFKVVHWMHYLNVSEQYLESSHQINTFLVPHLDHVDKVEKLRKLIGAGGFPIFMSCDQAERAARQLGCDYPFSYILPASDVTIVEAFNVVLASNFYPDGRKNEAWLKRFISENPDLNFTLTIVGKSWGPFVEELVTSKVEVEWYGPDSKIGLDYRLLLKVIHQADLFVYTGFDEGSLGALDAYLLNVPLLISDQGFHKEFDKRENISLFSNYDEFSTLLRQLIVQRGSTLMNSNKWTWGTYSDAHIQLWENLANDAHS